MGQTCTKCSRVNPEDAAYCYNDGAVLAGHLRNGGPVAAGSAPFSSPFVFPSGQQCRNFDELALACQNDWTAARELLGQGFFTSFLKTLGRADLAQAAKQASRFPDHDRGLDQLLGDLPTNVVDGPRLFVAPQEVNLGTLIVGENRRCELHLENRGMRLLYGSVTCDEGDWLALGESPGAPEKLFQFGVETIIPVHVKGKRLRASNKPLEGKLTVESNGGSITVIVRAEVPVKPYPDGVLKGATSPRKVAEKAKAAPKEAAPHFEKGAVAQWYKDNGWTYPVQGPSASGLGAVQQFFEALGLTPPPKVDISDRSLKWEVTAGETLRHALQIRSEEKRPVYAHATSNVPWLEVGRPKLNGRTAIIPLVIPSVPDRAGETLTAKVVVQANGNQRFVVPVTLVIGGNFKFTAEAAPIEVVPIKEKEAVIAEPVAKKPRSVAIPVPKVPETIIQTKRRPENFSPLHLVPLGVLLLVLIGIFVYDWHAGKDEKPPPPPEDILGGSAFNKPYENLKDREPRIGIDFDDRRRFGLVLLKEHDPKDPEKFKRLTYEVKGSTNNTCVKVDGSEYLFGNAGHGMFILDKDKKSLTPRGHERIGWDSVFKFTRDDIVVTQSVDFVAGQQSRVLDTVLVRYTIENKANIPHKVGMRMMLDTFIGANDGVPFAIPGSEGKKDRLVDTMEKFNQKDIPDYIQALEKPDLNDPGTVAHLGLLRPPPPTPAKEGEAPRVGFEQMQEMILCRWPDNKEMKWNIDPLESMNANGEKPDSCVVMYWAYETMNPGDVRKMAFTYGLGTISGVGGGDGRIALTTASGIQTDQDFTVTAYVKDPQEGQTVKLVLPDGFRFAKGHDAEKTVEKGKGGLAQVSWRVHSATKAGEYTLEATSGTASANVTLRLRDHGIFD